MVNIWYMNYYIVIIINSGYTRNYLYRLKFSIFGTA